MASSQTAKPIAHPCINRRVGEYHAKSSWSCCKAEGALIAKGRQCFRKQFGVAQPRPNEKVITNAMPRRSRPTQRSEPSGFPRPEARNAQNFQRNYERYLALARAEALAVDRIVAENYSSTPNTIFGQ
jgi:hypothetical protein